MQLTGAEAVSIAIILAAFSWMSGYMYGRELYRSIYHNLIREHYEKPTVEEQRRAAAKGQPS